jgi:hypothetical protein
MMLENKKLSRRVPLWKSKQNKKPMKNYPQTNQGYSKYESDFDLKYICKLCERILSLIIGLEKEKINSTKGQDAS